MYGEERGGCVSTLIIVTVLVIVTLIVIRERGGYNKSVCVPAYSKSSSSTWLA